MATRKITSQEQEIADLTGGRYRTDLPSGGVAMNSRPPTGGSTYVSKEENMSGAGRGKQGGPTAKEMEYRYSEDYMSPDTENKLKEEKRLNKMSAESSSQKYAKGGAVKKPQYMAFTKTGKIAGMRDVMAKGGMTASKRADGIAQRGKTRGKMC